MRNLRKKEKKEKPFPHTPLDRKYIIIFYKNTFFYKKHENKEYPNDNVHAQNIFERQDIDVINGTLCNKNLRIVQEKYLRVKLATEHRIERISEAVKIS